MSEWSNWLMPVLMATLGGAVLGSIVTAYVLARRHRNNLCKRKGNAKNKWKVYHTRTFRSARVAWLVEEMGVQEDFEFILYNPFTASEDQKLLYKARVHPHGTVPALVDHNNHITIESAAICFYLAELYQQLLPPGDRLADYFDWSIYAVTTVDSCLEVFDANLELQADHQDKKALKEAFKKGDVFAQFLDHHLKDKHYICGNKFTAADVVIGYSVMWASLIKGGQIIFDYSNVKSYLARLKARPAFLKAVGTPREWMNANDIALQTDNN